MSILHKSVGGEFCLPKPRYVADEFGDSQDLDVRVSRCGGQLTSTSNHTSNANLSEFSPKLIVAKVSCSLYLVKGIVIFARFDEAPAPPFCFDHKHPCGGQDQMVNLCALKGGAVEVNVAISCQPEVVEDCVSSRQAGQTRDYIEFRSCSRQFAGLLHGSDGLECEEVLWIRHRLQRRDGLARRACRGMR